ncbi:MAG TPA: hypothetical protein VGK04_07900 [Thermoanaerobaculia bacterium]
MQRLWIAAAATLVALSCQRETTQSTSPATTKPTTVARPQNLAKAKVNKIIDVAAVETQTQARLGSATAADGTVTAEKDTFKSGEPIILSMVIQQSPPHLQMSARWYDAKDKIIFEDRRPMNGAKVVSFTYGGKKLKPGKYRVVGYWGGNIAGEKAFTVTK